MNRMSTIPDALVTKDQRHDFQTPRAICRSVMWDGFCRTGMGPCTFERGNPARGSNRKLLSPPVTLTFTEGLEPAYSTIAVTDEADQPVPTGAATVSAEDASKLSVMPTKPFMPGIYKVDWHVLSKDGHSTSGSYRFSVKP